MEILRAFRTGAGIGGVFLLTTLTLMSACDDEPGRTAPPSATPLSQPAEPSSVPTVAPTPIATPRTISAALTPTPIPTPAPAPTPIPEGWEACAHYEVTSGQVDIRWTDPEVASLSLRLKTAGSNEWNIYDGGHASEHAVVALSAFGLTGSETLLGRFSSHTPPRGFTEHYSFTIDLAAVAFPAWAISSERFSVLCLRLGPPLARWNPTAPNGLTVHLSGDFTDTDGDGMTDAAEEKYGFDPRDALSFPTEPDLIVEADPERHLIEDSALGAYYEVRPGRIDIKWTDPEDGSYALSLTTEGSEEWNIYYGGHPLESAEVELSAFGLTGDETLVGRFTTYAPDGSFLAEHPSFTIDLSTVEVPAPPVPGDPLNRVSYTFSSDFPPEAERRYREFLIRVFPLLYEHLGPPAERLDVLIGYVPDSDRFVAARDGRVILTTGGFAPRAIVHEFAHAWKGKYTLTSGENWRYDDSLSGFEEGTAEGMALEIVHEYVRSYPDDPATNLMLSERTTRYWSRRAAVHDAIKNMRWTGGGDFWNPRHGEDNRYSIAGTTVQMMVRENPRFMKEFMALYYETIRLDPDWRPNRNDLIAIWEALVPELNGYHLREYLDTIPVFNGTRLDEGAYVLEAMEAYGETGDQQFVLAYADAAGWLHIYAQTLTILVEVADAHGREHLTHVSEIEWNRDSESTTGFGSHRIAALDMQRFPVGLYKETVTFPEYFEHDEGARETYYFFGLKDFDQDRESDYVIMIGVDGVPEGAAEIEILDGTHTTPISNGVAIFRSDQWPFDMQGRFPITITNANGESRTYYRTLIEAGTRDGFFQHQFIIIDTDFDGVEDQFDGLRSSP